MLLQRVLFVFSLRYIRHQSVHIDVSSLTTGQGLRNTPVGVCGWLADVKLLLPTVQKQPRKMTLMPSLAPEPAQLQLLLYANRCMFTASRPTAVRYANLQQRHQTQGIFTLDSSVSSIFLLERFIMNSIIYIVGLVVIIGVVLSYFGFR